MAIYLCRCPLLGIGFLETLATPEGEKANLVKTSSADLRTANLFAQVDGGW